MTDFPPLVDPALFEALKPPKDVDAQVLAVQLRFIKAYVDQVLKDLAKLQLGGKEEQPVACKASDSDGVVLSGPSADEDQAGAVRVGKPPEPTLSLESSPVTVETGPKRATWYMVYIGQTIGPVLGGERANLAVGGVKNPYKQECASEDEARELFHKALCADEPTIFCEIPAVRHAVRWEDYYPDTPRPAKYISSDDQNGA